MPENAGVADFKHGNRILAKRAARQGSGMLSARRRFATTQSVLHLLSGSIHGTRSQGKWAASVDLCKTAVSLKRNEVQLYLNLAEVYMAAGRRDHAVETLDAASRYCARRPARRPYAWQFGAAQRSGSAVS